MLCNVYCDEYDSSTTPVRLQYDSSTTPVRLQYDSSTTPVRLRTQNLGSVDMPCIR
ncbi:hypothetical protein [Anaplasma phagocytophilum]|uniref:hypothetical protein n=1 Tax=Anaplasma phagocytophilum TaxID=948 RepID=UPI0012DA7426|nr:hypothetical protein [Anaplasma phagocytophilum]